MNIMSANSSGPFVWGRTGAAGELVGKLKMDSPSATPRFHGQGRSFRRAGPLRIIGCSPRMIEHGLVYIVILCLVFLYLAGCGRQDDLDINEILFPQQRLCKLCDMVSSTSARSWVAFAPSLLTLVAARACQQCSTPYHRLEKTSTETDAATYTEWTISAIQALQTWYNESSGLWDTTGWWNSANCLTMLGDFYALDSSEASKLGLNEVFSNTFTQAQQTSLQGVSKTYVTTSNGLRMVESSWTDSGATGSSAIAKRGFPGFINDYYDDEGWWALAWIRAYDVTSDAAYLSMAESIFADMEGGVNGTCGGGIWWSKDRTYKNAIANELYLAVAASLANRVSTSDSYLPIAEGQWEWFYNSGMINSQNLINDGLTINADGTCTNNGDTTWTYNQGVILGGLVELYKANGNASLLTEATTIAEAAINGLSVNGILHESCEDDNCGADGSQFKGQSHIASYLYL